MTKPKRGTLMIAARALSAFVLGLTAAVVVIQAPAQADPSYDYSLCPSCTYVLGVEWEDNNYMGNRMTMRANFQCTLTSGDLDLGFGNLPSEWPNEISSFQNSNNCYTRHWDGVNFTGGSSGQNDDSTSMPTVPGNDAAESFKLT